MQVIQAEPDEPCAGEHGEPAVGELDPGMLVQEIIERFGGQERAVHERESIVDEARIEARDEGTPDDGEGKKG
jgi:hypothetical protein